MLGSRQGRAKDAFAPEYPMSEPTSSGKNGGGVERSKRPTPARGTAAEGTVADTPSVPSTREITVDNEPWLVRQTGSGTIGTGLARPARVMEITFCPAADPEGAQRRTLTTVSSLESLSDEELAELFRRAVP